MGCNWNEIIRQFNVDATSQPYGEGHINDTFLAEMGSGKYILQRINHHVFQDPEKLMENIVRVTEYLHNKIANRGGCPERETLIVIKTVNGKNLYCTEDGDYFRMYRFVENSKTYQAVENPEQFYESGKAFGRFQNDLADFPAGKLYDTIENFHHTANRFEKFLEAVEEDRAGRKASVESEIDFVLSRKNDTKVIVDLIEKGEIPVRVTHNDTKLNNILFDNETDKALCVIDLDTVMPGSMLYDFGDAIRFGASTAAEDECCLEKVTCSLPLFEAFTKGFLEELKQSITPKEKELLPFSAKLITLECGMRFLTDYLNGDTYFKIHRPGHNLDRCRTQFRLVTDMEEKMQELQKIVSQY